MLDITLANFEADVITASMQQPVLLDIWAPWCGPCKALGPALEKLEIDYGGRFRLTKLNADEQPEISGQLSQMFGVRSIPLCVLFKQGQPVDGFVGALPEAELRRFLDRHVPTPHELAGLEDVEQAHALMAGGDTEAAVDRLREAVTLDPANDTARFDYLRALLAAGRVAQAQAAYEPVAARALADARLAACGLWIAACDAAQRGKLVEDLRSLISANGRDLDSRFELAQQHFARGRFTDALDELLEILMRDRDWREGSARRLYLAILEVMRSDAQARNAPESPTPVTLELSEQGRKAAPSSMVDTYHRRLSMTLF